MSKLLTGLLFATGVISTLGILGFTGQKLYKSWDELNQEVPFKYQMASPKPDLFAETPHVLGTSTDSADTNLEPTYSASPSSQLTISPTPTPTPTISPSSHQPTTPQPYNPTTVQEGTVTRIDEAGEWRIYRLKEAGVIVELPSSIVMHNQLRHQSWKLGSFNRHCWTVALQASRVFPFRLIPQAQADGNTCTTERLSFAITTKEENVGRTLTLHDVVTVTQKDNAIEVELIDGKKETLSNVEAFNKGWKIKQSILLPANMTGFVLPISKSGFSTVTILFDTQRISEKLIQQILETVVIN